MRDSTSWPRPHLLFVAIAAISLVLIWGAAEEQCVKNGGECEDPDLPSTLETPPSEPADAAPGTDNHSEEDAKNGTRGEPLRLEDLGLWRIGIVLGLLGAVVLWILATIKFAIDGSLPARLAMWGFLPEAYAAVSVRAVVSLLRLKQTSTPVIVLRSCVTDAGAKELAEAIRKYDKIAGVEALELPHNPQLGQEGVRALVAEAMREDSQLQEFDLSYNPQFAGYIVDEVLPLFPYKASKINIIKLMDCGLNKAEVQKLADGLAKSGMKTIDLSLNPLSGAGEVLAAICEGPFLEEISVQRCGLTPEDVGALAAELPFSSIKSVQLGGNRIGAAGLAALVEHLPTCQVDELGLEANSLKVQDLDILGMAWVKRPFSRVKLSGNRMTDEEIANFVRTLRTLHS